MDTTPPLAASPMTEDVLQQIFSSDQDMYPAPLTYARLQSWVTASPQLSQSFYLLDQPGSKENRKRDVVAGVLIALPLREAPWQDLLVGKLRETDIDANSMIAPKDVAGCAVGLHVFHVERLSEHAKGFTRFSIGYADMVAKAIGWNVLGCSALTATKDGANTFEKLGFQPTGYEEFWIQKSDEISLVPLYPGHDRSSVLAEQDKSSIKGQARMSVKFAEQGITNP
ncbi:hypothetical protein PFICI_03385 [Pestalotiopsis fici W106-1]|uniref:N-acetyltransferase domain-containing protein n=1 Tax=Pestalotiopsis fici (strain W106-1 / CGMCC3.15140) TaxID=1229662 RepID=W3XH48_PESFW|nr:uncharacterized protein PFICI_03385 [Pestalotiopsis fici W106-1]ETS85360.1 hypothetical protein PFICI_03385 [Pestalotiopsis fici W106-1]